MVSSYTPPDVIVEQKRRTSVGAARPPQLPPVVVGPAVQIETREKAGDYDATVELEVPFPNLTPGGLVDEDTIQILLDARDDAGRPLGLFELSTDDYTVLTNDDLEPTGLLISGDIALQLSILSLRNNNTDADDDDRGTGTPEGISFTDDSIDFLSRGATPSGDSFIVIDSPASMAGVYRINQMIPNGNVVNEVILEKVLATDWDQPELVKQLSLLGNPENAATGSTIRGMDADHESVVVDGQVSNTVSYGYGIGVQGIISIDDGVTEFGSADIDNLLTVAGDYLQLPGPADSVDVEFAPFDVGDNPTNRNDPLWASMIQNVAIGDWMRVHFTDLAPAARYRDFKIVGIDTINNSLVVNAMGNSTPGPVTIVFGSIQIDKIQFFNVLKGKNDAVNGAGDFYVFTLGGIEYRMELLTVTPSAVVTVDTLPDISGLLENTEAGPDNISNISYANPGVVTFTTPGFVQDPLWGTGGYYVRIVGSDEVDGVYPITAVDGGLNQVTLDADFSAASGATFGAATVVTFAQAVTDAQRGIPFRNSVASYDLQKRLEDGWGGSVLVSYQAARRDLPLEGLLELESIQDIEEQIGVIHPDNPLALGASQVVKSGLADGSRTFFALATDGDTLLAHQEALETLETEDLYYILPLTQERAIIDAYIGHVDSQSQPENKHERVLFASGILTEVQAIIPDAGQPNPSGTVLNQNEFESTVADWGQVQPGHMLKLLQGDGTVEFEARVLSVDLSNNKVEILTDFPSALIGETREFKVDTYPLTKFEQAEQWRDEALSIANFRVSMIRPDQCEITFTDKTLPSALDREITVGMEYGCCAFGGVCAALPPEQPMTNIPIPGINALIHSNFYFSPAQLNTIAEGGNNILVQEARTSVPFSRHQLTTDMTSITTRELSIVKIVDFAAKYIRNGLRPYIGNHNITQEYLTQLRGNTEAIIKALVRADILLSNTELLKLRQNPDELDSIIIEIALDIPYPANRIYVTLFI